MFIEVDSLFGLLTTRVTIRAQRCVRIAVGLIVVALVALRVRLGHRAAVRAARFENATTRLNIFVALGNCSSDSGLTKKLKIFVIDRLVGFAAACGTRRVRAVLEVINGFFMIRIKIHVFGFRIGEGIRMAIVIGGIRYSVGGGVV